MRLRLLGGAGVFFLLILASSACADPILDQSHPWPAHSVGSLDLYGGQYFAQTYTAGMDGTLAGVTISAWPYQSNCALQVSINQVVAGTPTFNTLGSVMFPVGSPPPGSYNMYVDFLSQSIQQDPGTQYAIVLGCPGGTGGPLGVWTVGYAGHNPYAAGASWIYSGGAWSGGSDTWRDFHFQTYVSVPEPATLLLLGIGLAGLLLRRQN